MDDPIPTGNNINNNTSNKQIPSPASETGSNWTATARQHLYSTKLLHALRRSSPSKPRHVRRAADRILASAARGRSRWSRAVLRRSRSKPTSARKPRVIKPPKASTTRPLPEVERKAAVLARLVPGCRKLPFPALLDETSDYIAALQMQVKAMSALAHILSSPS